MENSVEKLAYNFADHIIETQQQQGSVLICGLDPQLKKIPTNLFFKYRNLELGKMISMVICEFNERIIDAVIPFVCGFKLQVAFYEQYGSAGWEALEWTVKYIRDAGLPCILDAKRGDGGNAAAAYAGLLAGIAVPYMIDNKLIWEREPGLNVDCMTVHGWIDEAQMQPMLEKVKPTGKGLQVVCKTLFSPLSRIEELILPDGHKVWQKLASFVREWSEGTEGEKGYRTIGVVLGSILPNDALIMRNILPNNLFLIPSYYDQDQNIVDADQIVLSFNKDGFGGMVNSSGGILYAYMKGPFACQEEDFSKAAAREAELFRNELNESLKKIINLKEV